MESFSENRFDAIIVGAGPGGSTLAALLAKEGLRVLLVERHSRAGGKMQSVEKGGFVYEMFPINAVPSRNSLFEKLVSDFGLEDKVQVIYPNPVGRFYFELPDGEIRTLEMSNKTPSPLGFKHLLGLTWVGFFKFIRVFAKMTSMKADQQAALSRISALDYINQQNLPQSLKSYLLSVYTEGFFEAPPDRVSAAAMIGAVQQTVNYGGGRYYRVGVGSVFQAFAQVVERYGSIVLYKTKVDRILTEQNRVTGIQAGGIEYHAPIVISNAGIQPTVLKLVGEEAFDPAYIEWVKNLEMNLANVGFRWFLNKAVLTSPMNVYISYNSVTTLDDFQQMEQGKFPNHSYVYLGTTSLYPGLAPEGKQLVYACMSCLGNPDVNIRPYLEKVKRIVQKMAPDLFDHIEHEETFGPAEISKMGRDRVLPARGGEDYGVALTVSQYKDERLDGRSPIEGLFYVGCDAGGFGLGTHQAVDSAVNVSQKVLEYHGTRLPD